MNWPARDSDNSVKLVSCLKRHDSKEYLFGGKDSSATVRLALVKILFV